MKQLFLFSSCIIMLLTTISCANTQNNQTVPIVTKTVQNTVVIETEIETSYRDKPIIEETVKEETTNKLPTLLEDDWMLEDYYYVCSGEYLGQSFNSSIFAITRKGTKLSGYIWWEWDIGQALTMEDALTIEGTYEEGHAYFQEIDDFGNVLSSVTTSINKSGNEIDHNTSSAQLADGTITSFAYLCYYMDGRSDFESYLTESGLLTMMYDDMVGVMVTLVRRVDLYFIEPYLEYPIFAQDKNEVEEINNESDIYLYLSLMRENLFEDREVKRLCVVVEKDGQCWMQIEDYRFEFKKTAEGNYVIYSIIYEASNMDEEPSTTEELTQTQTDFLPTIAEENMTIQNDNNLDAEIEIPTLESETVIIEETTIELPILLEEDWMLENYYYMFAARSFDNPISTIFMYAITRDGTKLTGYAWPQKWIDDTLVLEDALPVTGSYEDGYARLQIMDYSNKILYSVITDIDKNGDKNLDNYASIQLEDGTIAEYGQSCSHIDKRSNFESHLSESNQLNILFNDMMELFFSVMRKWNILKEYIEYPITVYEENEVIELTDFFAVKDYLTNVALDVRWETKMEEYSSIIVEEDGQCWMQLEEYRIEFGKTDAGNYVIRSIIRTMNE